MTDDLWPLLINELREKFPAGWIAHNIGISERQLYNILHGDKPKGAVAVNLFLLHVKHGTPVQSIGTVVHSTVSATAVR